MEVVVVDGRIGVTTRRTGDIELSSDESLGTDSPMLLCFNALGMRLKASNF